MNTSTSGCARHAQARCAPGARRGFSARSRVERNATASACCGACARATASCCRSGRTASANSARSGFAVRRLVRQHKSRITHLQRVDLLRARTAARTADADCNATAHRAAIAHQPRPPRSDRIETEYQQRRLPARARAQTSLAQSSGIGRLFEHMLRDHELETVVGERQLRRSQRAAPVKSPPPPGDSSTTWLSRCAGSFGATIMRTQEQTRCCRRRRTESARAPPARADSSACRGGAA